MLLGRLALLLFKQVGNGKGELLQQYGTVKQLSFGYLLKFVFFGTFLSLYPRLWRWLLQLHM